MQQKITSWEIGTRIRQQKETIQKKRNERKDRYSQAQINGKQQQITDMIKGEEQGQRKRQGKSNWKTGTGIKRKKDTGGQ